MRVGLHDSEKNNFPNIALAKLSAYHKSKGDVVELFCAESGRRLGARSTSVRSKVKNSCLQCSSSRV